MSSEEDEFNEKVKRAWEENKVDMDVLNRCKPGYKHEWAHVDMNEWQCIWCGRYRKISAPFREDS